MIVYKVIVYKVQGESSGVALEYVLTRRSSSEFGTGAARESPRAIEHRTIEHRTIEPFGDGDRP